MEQQAAAEEKSAQLWATWKRGFFMVLFWVILRITEFVVIGVGLAQFVLKLSTGSIHPKIQAFGDSLTTFAHQLFAFLTYNSDEKPFPFREWPKSTLPTKMEQPEETTGTTIEGVAEKGAGEGETAPEGEQKVSMPESSEIAEGEIVEPEQAAEEEREKTTGKRSRKKAESEAAEAASAGEEEPSSTMPPPEKPASSQPGASAP